MKRPIIVILLVSLLALIGAGESLAQQKLRPYRASLALGLGGAADEKADTGYGNTGFQLGFSWDTDEITRVGLRLAQLDFDKSFSGLGSGELTYVTVAGEYVFNEGSYESGIYAGLGAYRLEGTTALGVVQEESLGLSVGVTGDFPISQRLAFLLELSGHYTNLSANKLWVLGHGGFSYRF